MLREHIQNLKTEIENFKHCNEFDPIKVNRDPISEELYKEVKQNGTRNYAEFAEALGISETTVKRRLNDLKKSGFIRRVGSNKNGYWEILK